MKRWEHARLIVKLTGEKRFNRITLFGAKGPKNGQLIGFGKTKEGELAKDPDEWMAMDQAIADLGSEGWELVGVTQLTVGRSAGDQEWHFWFKRPSAEN